MLRCVLHTEGRRLELHPQIWLKILNQAQIPLSEADLVHQMHLALRVPNPFDVPRSTEFVLG